MNMAATLFRLTVEECLLGVTREAARALGRDDIGTLEAGKRCDLAIWDIEQPAELVYRMGFNPLHPRVFGGVDDLTGCRSHRGDAPLIVSLPHTGTEIPPEIEARLDLALAGAQGRRLVHREAVRFRPDRWAPQSSAPTVSRTVIDVNRDPSGASLYPGQATTELCPTTTFDGEPLYRDGASPRRKKSPARARALFRSLPCRARRRDCTPAPAACAKWCCTKPLDPLASCRGCSRASCRISTSARTAARAATRR